MDSCSLGFLRAKDALELHNDKILGGSHGGWVDDLEDVEQLTKVRLANQQLYFTSHMRGDYINLLT